MGYKETFEKLGENPVNVYEEAVKILCKIADNILNAPSNSKKRTLQKNNATISSKIMSIKGGSECLKLMGFSENDTSFTMATSMPLKCVEEFKKSIIAWRKLMEQKSRTNEKVNINTAQPLSSNVESNQIKTVIKRIVLPPLVLTFSNPFLRRLETMSHKVLQYEDKNLQERTRNIIPVAVLEANAEKRLRRIQEQLKMLKLDDLDLSIQDTMILELLRWFKEEFFEWVDSPSCESCGKKTSFSHMSTDPKQLHYTDRVELHRCKSCSKFTPFPRYGDLNILLETRKGRCGEWADVFTLCCRSLGWDSRYVLDETDHVWTEVYSTARKRWVHCDACENACDTPLMYESGWGKQISYVIAYSAEEVQDVTWRYTSDHRAALGRRRLCSEQELLGAMLELRRRRQEGLSVYRRRYLSKRLAMELVELMQEKQPDNEETKGRSSGSTAWKMARGEVEETPPAGHVWHINAGALPTDAIAIRYCSALDVYECVSGGRQLCKATGWAKGTFENRGVFRKVERDWRMAYLARREGVDTGTVAWKINIVNPKKQLQIVSVEFDHKTYENGIVDFTICAGDICVSLPKGKKVGIFTNFSGCDCLILRANLSGGKGDVAWQHAQLFRQSIESKDYTLGITLIFG